MYWWDESDLPEPPTPTISGARAFVFYAGPLIVFLLIAVPVAVLYGRPSGPLPLWFSLPLTVGLCGTMFGPILIAERRHVKRSKSLERETLFDAIYLSLRGPVFCFRRAAVQRAESEQAWAETCAMLDRCGAGGFDVYAPKALREAIETAREPMNEPRRQMFGQRDSLLFFLIPYFLGAIALSVLLLVAIELFDYATSYTWDVQSSVSGAYGWVALIAISALLLGMMTAGAWPYRLQAGRVREALGAEWRRGDACIYLTARRAGRNKLQLVNARLVGPQGTATLQFSRGVKSKKFQSLWKLWLSNPGDSA